MRCYRMQSAGEDPQLLLREENQWRPPRDAVEDGARCERCRGRGRTGHECWSCLLTGTDRACPACRGRVRFEGTCPACHGTGCADAKPRRGITVFPKAEGLYHYLLATDADLVGVLVELEAEPAQDVDFDADQGAILVIPTAIEHVRPIEPEAVQTIRGLAAG